MPILKTVRAKLMTLVGLSALAAAAALPVLEHVMSRQLIDIVDDRAPDALRGFEIELGDDLADLDAATRTLSDSDEIERALDRHDRDAARAELAVFHEAYPGIGLVVLNDDGTPLADVGLASFDATKIRQDDRARSGGEVRMVLASGCEPSDTTGPAYAVARRARGRGFVVGCMRVDEGYLSNSAQKLGVELAVATKGGGAQIATRAFPIRTLPSRDADVPELVDDGGRLWALRRFVPKVFRDDQSEHVSVVVALDVSRIGAIVHQDLWITVAVLLAGAIVAIVFGARLASTMSRALGRVNGALKRLEHAEYVHVVPVRTGDEIEDLATGFNTMVDGLRERDKLRSTFGKYMTEAVMDHLMKGKVALGGETLTVTILFTDIRSFTSLSEGMDAHDLVALLNEYFTEMVGVIIQEDGVVDKYIGDAIMAVFGAPVPKADDAVRAVTAAVRMRRGLAALNERLAARGKPPIMTGIGIHTGEVVAGNIGSEARMEYTVIGDAVNLASRLEGATKELGVHVLVSEDTVNLLGDAFHTRPVKEITVKGRVRPVMTYEVIGLRGGDARASAPATPAAAPTPTS